MTHPQSTRNDNLFLADKRDEVHFVSNKKTTAAVEPLGSLNYSVISPIICQEYSQSKGYKSLCGGNKNNKYPSYISLPFWRLFKIGLSLY
jgi:hypothetical protein